MTKPASKSNGQPPAGTVAVEVLVDMIESKAHVIGCGPDCLCALVIKIPTVGREIERRLNERRR